MDPTENRPMSLGRKGNAWVMASENHKFEEHGIEFVREFVGGEIVKITPNGDISSQFFGEPRRKKRCLFERVYFARRGSFIGGQRVEEFRKSTGRIAAEHMTEKGITVEAVVPINGSGAAFGEGMSEKLGVPMVPVRKVDEEERTFLKPDEASRDESAEKAYVMDSSGIRGLRVAGADDSDVRGRTLRVTTSLLWDGGAREVHRAIGSAPIFNICDMGVDMATRTELTNGGMNGTPLPMIEEKRAGEVKATTVTHLSLGDMERSLGSNESFEDMCYHCFGGPHPFKENTDVFPRLDRKVDQPKIEIWRKAADMTNLTSDENRKQVAIGEDFVLPLVEDIQADILVLMGKPVGLGDEYLKKLQERQIPVMVVHDALVANDGRPTVNTFHGEIQVKKGETGMLMNVDQAPVSGVTAYQLIPGVDGQIGPIILKEEVSRREEANDDFRRRMFESQHRVLEVASSRVSHMMQRGINIAPGFPW